MSYSLVPQRGGGGGGEWISSLSTPTYVQRGSKDRLQEPAKAAEQLGERIAVAKNAVRAKALDKPQINPLRTVVLQEKEASALGLKGARAKGKSVAPKYKSSPSQKKTIARTKADVDSLSKQVGAGLYF